MVSEDVAIEEVILEEAPLKEVILEEAPSTEQTPALEEQTGVKKMNLPNHKWKPSKSNDSLLTIYERIGCN